MSDPICIHLGEPPDRARVVCVLVHGRGQTADDMQSAVIARIDTPGIRWMLPCAHGKSWYKARAIDRLTDATRGELTASLNALAAVVAEAHEDGLPVVLAGFSQGACLAVEFLFRDGPVVAACVALTGCRLGVAGDKRPRADLAGLPVVLTGSDDDPWIPVGAFAAAAGELGIARARLRAEVYPGRAHEVTDDEIAILDATLARHAGVATAGAGA